MAGGLPPKVCACIELAVITSNAVDAKWLTCCFKYLSIIESGMGYYSSKIQKKIIPNNLPNLFMYREGLPKEALLFAGVAGVAPSLQRDLFDAYAVLQKASR
ncbi:MAG: hypothetical protein ABIP28_05090 [Mucilaginibacter sp.]